MAKQITKSKINPVDVEVPLQFNAPVDMPSVYATNVVLQPMEHEIVISFYEMQPPLVFGGSNEADNLKILQKTGMRADCVAKVIIAKERFGAFADLMKQLDNILKKAEKKEKDA